MKKHLGLVGALLFFLTGLVISLATWHGLGLTISQHVALSSPATIIFAILAGLGSLLIAYDLCFYIAKKWHLSLIYKSIATITSILLVILCIVPYTGGVSGGIHQFAAWAAIYAIILLLVDVIIELWRRFGKPTKIYFVVVSTSIIALVAIKLFLPEIYTGNVFILENIYLLQFFGLAVCLSYNKVESH
jgi:hypothetical protein